MSVDESQALALINRGLAEDLVALAGGRGARCSTFFGGSVSDTMTLVGAILAASAPRYEGKSIGYGRNFHFGYANSGTTSSS